MSVKVNDSDRNREKILAIALEEFGNQGYQNASTNMVCKRADLSKGLLFHYYQNKGQLFYEVAKLCVGEMDETLADLGQPEELDIQQVCVYYRRRMQFFLEHPHHKRILGEVFLLPDDVIASTPIVELRKQLFLERQKMFELLLKTIPIKEEFAQRQALELMIIASEYLHQKYLDDYRYNHDFTQSLEAFSAEHKQALQMLFEGIRQND